MEIEEAILIQKRNTLYAILALLLAIVALVVLLSLNNYSRGQQESGAFCGVDSIESNHPPQYQKGKELFVANCAACHNKNMNDNLTGPALAGVEGRWSAFPRADLYRWMRGSQAMIKSGHPRAKDLWAKWKPVIMNDFVALSDEDIEALLFYIRRQSGPGRLETSDTKAQ